MSPKAGVGKGTKYGCGGKNQEEVIFTSYYY